MFTIDIRTYFLAAVISDGQNGFSHLKWKSLGNDIYKMPIKPYKKTAKQNVRVIGQQLDEI